MENTKTTKQKPITLNECKTVGDEIKFLVCRYTGQLLGSYTLERALEEVKKNDEKLEQFKTKLLK